MPVQVSRRLLRRLLDAAFAELSRAQRSPDEALFRTIGPPRGIAKRQRDAGQLAVGTVLQGASLPFTGLRRRRLHGTFDQLSLLSRPEQSLP